MMNETSGTSGAAMQRHASDHTPVSPGSAAHGEIEILEEHDAWCCDTARLAVARVRIPPHDGAAATEREVFRLAHAPGQDDGVVIVPLDEANRIILIRQFRHPVRMWMRELPRGGRKQGESVRACAARELREELGLDLVECHTLGRMATDSGQQESLPHLVLARVRGGREPRREPIEVIDGTFRYSYGELRKSCERGDIIDSFTLVAALRLAPHWDGDTLKIDSARSTRM
jgi:ADP-ribose pyrophosphatase